MGPRYYTLRVATSHKSATAFGLSAKCDEDAVGQALSVLKNFDNFCDRPAFQVVRADGTVVQGVTRHAQAG